MKLLHNIEVERNGQSDIVIRWYPTTSEVEYLVYSGSFPDCIDYKKPIAITRDHSVVISMADINGRRYFDVVARAEIGRIVSERHIDFQGITNFRDLGGYTTEDGRTVKWGMLYRSGNISEATDGDISILSKFGLRNVIDLTASYEGGSRKRQLQEELHFQVHRYALISEKIMKRYYGEVNESIDVAGADALIHTMYKAFVSECASQIGDVVRLIADLQNLPLLIYCNIGKDRTGFVTAIILRTLGVSKEIAMKDYLLSGCYISSENYGRRLSRVPKAIRSAIERTEHKYLDYAFQTIEDMYGSFDGYLQKGLEIDEDQLLNLRNILLE